jgi:hypothetical protein
MSLFLCLLLLAAGAHAVAQPYVVFLPDQVKLLQTLAIVCMALSGFILIAVAIIIVSWYLTRRFRATRKGELAQGVVPFTYDIK